MFKKLLAILLIISLQSVAFAMLLADAGFKLNEKYIAEKLCENKAKPKLQCQGKCFLKKMQKKAAEQEDANKNLLKEIQFQQLFYNQVSGIVFTPSHTTNFQIPVNNNGCLKGWPDKVLRPPGIS